MLTVTRSLAVPARPAAVKALLCDTSRWPELLPPLERAGSFWLLGGELFTITTTDDGDTLRILAEAPLVRGSLLIRLRDAHTTTHLDLTLRLETGPGVRVRRAAINATIDIIEHRLALRLAPPAPPTDDLRARFPLTAAAFAAMGSDDHWEGVVRLDAIWRDIRATAGGSPAAPADVYELRNDIPAPTYDLIYAGGGLGLLHAAVMAQRGHRVLLFDRGEVGCAHREWNISREELAALVATGFCSWQELEPIVMREYRRGIVRFYPGPHHPPTDLWLDHVLDVALDAGALLQLARRKLAQAGGDIRDWRIFRRVQVSERGPVRVAVELASEHGEREQYTARLLMDGMGSISPLALLRFGGLPFAGVCPTVGTVVRGLEPGDGQDQFNPQIGDILLSVADAQRGQQYMWEGFPGRHDELTVYLFYYDTLTGPRGGAARRADARRESPGLLELFEDYFALLPTYKRPGPDFAHLKPVYGYIPARHSVQQQEAPLLRGVLPIGDSAAQQSPLTFCGFGSHVRNLERTVSLTSYALANELLEPQHLRDISSHQVNVSLNWVFSRFMQPWGGADDVNRVQNVFLGVLNWLGHDLAQRFFRDRMRWSDYPKLVLGMFWRYPRIVDDAWRVLGPRGWQRWFADIGRFSVAAAEARLARALGPHGWQWLSAAAERRSPALALRLRARRAAWQAMGWAESDRAEAASAVDASALVARGGRRDF